jgi:glycerophosphoryl diester phosphodiesterase
MYPVRLLLVGTLLFLWTSSHSQILMDNTIVVQGHRGCRGLLPENTIPAFLQALELGVSTLEMDVVVTADQRVIVSHEPWMNPDICVAPDGSKILRAKAKRLNIYTMTLAEAQSYRLGTKAYSKFPDQQQVETRKPSLTEVVSEVRAWCLANGQDLPGFNIEIKSMAAGDGLFHPGPQEYAQQFLKEFLGLDIELQSTIQSFDPRLLRAIENEHSGLNLIYLIDHKRDLPNNFESRFDFKLFGISPDKQLVNKEVVDFCSEKGYLLSVWTVNDSEEIQALIDLGIRNIISDYPNLLIEIAKQNDLRIAR